MDHFYFLLGLCAVALVAFFLSLRRSLDRRFRLPYVADTTLFTPAQRVFRGVLEQALGQDYRVYGKVRVADVIAPQARLSRRERERALERLDGLRFDFLICAPDTAAIACAINLSPRSRLRQSFPRERLDRICAAARLPFVRVHESDRYAVAEIGERVFAAMQARWGMPDEAEIPLTDAIDVLDGLSAIVLQQDRDAADAAASARVSISAHQRPARQPRLPKARAPTRPRDTRQSSVPVRQEPSILDRDDLDTGPSFRLGDALEQETAHPRSRFTL